MPILIRYILGFSFVFIFAFVNLKLNTMLYKKKKIYVFLIPIILFLISVVYFIYTRFATGWDPILYYIIGVLIFGLAIISAISSIIILLVHTNIKEK